MNKKTPFRLNKFAMSRAINLLEEMNLMSSAVVKKSTPKFWGKYVGCMVNLTIVIRDSGIDASVGLGADFDAIIEFVSQYGGAKADDLYTAHSEFKSATQAIRDHLEATSDFEALCIFVKAHRDVVEASGTETSALDDMTVHRLLHLSRQVSECGYGKVSEAGLLGVVDTFPMDDTDTYREVMSMTKHFVNKWLGKREGNEG